MRVVTKFLITILFKGKVISGIQNTHRNIWMSYFNMTNLLNQSRIHSINIIDYSKKLKKRLPF